jgi:hypothetical protein
MKQLSTIIASLVLFSAVQAYAQTPDSIKQALYKVNKVFDSSTFLAFDVNITYSTDTLFGQYQHEELNGEYIVNQNNLYYKIGDIEYIQNDSFVYNIYHDEKMLMMTRDLISNTSSKFPLREFVDSTIAWYDTAYTISLSTTDADYKVIKFTAKPDQQDVPYRSFSITYAPDNYYPDKFELTMYEALDNLPDMPDSIYQYIKIRRVHKYITMSFTNYHNPTNLEVFDNDTYVFYNRQRKRYQPSEKMKDFQFLANGVDNDEYDKTIEIMPPVKQ